MHYAPTQIRRIYQHTAASVRIKARNPLPRPSVLVPSTWRYNDGVRRHANNVVFGRTRHRLDDSGLKAEDVCGDSGGLLAFLSFHASFSFLFLLFRLPLTPLAIRPTFGAIAASFSWRFYFHSLIYYRLLVSFTIYHHQHIIDDTASYPALM